MSEKTPTYGSAPETPERTLRSLATMLGWVNVPPRSALEQSVAALKARAAAPLFVNGEFTLHSGEASRWKIDCDALTSQDWRTLALIASTILPPFRAVEGVPRGGLPFAEALRKHAQPNNPEAWLLIADDVGTTGASMEEQRAGREAYGVVAFARGSLAPWIKPLFVMPVATIGEEDLCVLRETRRLAVAKHIAETKRKNTWDASGDFAHSDECLSTSEALQVHLDSQLTPEERALIAEGK